MNKISMLILDDEQYVLSALKRLFHSPKYDIFTAATTPQAIEILEKYPAIGIIICDQKLGDDKGTDFLSLTKTKWPDISRILLTGYFNSQIAEDSLLKGEVYRFVSKPWNDDDLRMTVETSWQRHELLKQNRELLNLIRSQNDHLKHLGLNLKQVIENRIEKTVQSQSAIQSKKIQLQITHSLIKGLSHATSLKEIFKIILKELKKLIPFDSASIIVQMGPHHHLLLNQKSQTTSFPLEKFELIKHLFSHPLPIVTHKAPPILWDNKKQASYFIFPLMDENKSDPTCMATLNLASRKPRAFSDEDIKKLTDIASPIAIAIEKMKLLEIIEQGSRQWESTFDAISDLVTVIDKDFNLLKANRATEKITHQKVESVIGKKCYEVLAGRKTPCQNCPALESLKQSTVTPEHEIKDFKDKDYLSWSFPMLDAKNKISSIVMYYRDQTEPSHLFRQLIQSEKMAAIGHLASSLAHELNNPLTGITALAQLLNKELDKKDPHFSDISEIERASLRCKEIIENLLDFSEKTKSSKKTWTSINDILEATLPLIQYSRKAEQPIHIVKHLAEPLPKIKANPNELQQVFFNLLLNALQAMPEGGNLSITTQYDPQKSAVQIKIKDTGIGIPKENISKIFDPFYSTKEKTHGTGLGLTVSYGIIKDHQGKIEVQSQLKKGSLFKVTLPIQEKTH
ncbi:MAG: response regulator [Deltaproteobacteria bacterium]|nr:response regulator [Deltaproteobacteria bacterium]